MRRSTAQRLALFVAVPATMVLAHSSAIAAPGDLDPQFGEAGLTISHVAPGAAPDLQNGLAVQPDGRIVVGGESFMGSGRGWEWRLTRLLADGAVDPSFADSGVALINMSSVGGFDERIVSVAVQPDGKVIAAGYVLTSPTNQDSALARFNSDGTLDATFGNGGRVVTDIVPSPQHDFINHVLLDAAGNLVVGGGCQHFFVARYKPDGQLDSSFNPDGPHPGVNIIEAAPGEANAEILGMALDPRGRIVAAGYSTTTDHRVDTAVARFASDGILDRSFNANGAVPGVLVRGVAPREGWDLAFRVAVDRRGRIITVGDAYVGFGAGFFDIALSRYTADGAVDESFGSGGTVFTNAGPADSDDNAQGLVLQPDGKILVGGSAAPTAFRFDSDFMVARFLANGELDPSFGSGGISVTPTAPGAADDAISSMAMQGATHVVAAGECDQDETGRDVCVARYDLRQVGASNGRALR